LLRVGFEIRARVIKLFLEFVHKMFLFSI
jgi:hypothetical protein